MLTYHYLWNFSVVYKTSNELNEFTVQFKQTYLLQCVITIIRAAPITAELIETITKVSIHPISPDVSPGIFSIKQFYQ